MEGLARKPEKTIKELTLEQLLHRWWTQNSGKETVEGQAGKPEETKPRNRFSFTDYIREAGFIREDEMRVLRIKQEDQLSAIEAYLREEDELRMLRDDEIRAWRAQLREMKKLIRKECAKEDKKLEEEAAKIKAETKELSQKPESDPQVVETAEFVTKMTEEILEQKARLTKSNVNKTGKRSNLQNKGDGVFERLRSNNLADHSPETIEPKNKLRTERAAKENVEDCAQRRKYHDLLTGEYHGSVSLKDEKAMSGDQVIQTTTTRQLEFANNRASPKDVCCDVKKYIQQISRLVHEQISSLSEEVKRKLESVMMSFQRLITGMWKLLLYNLLLYEMTSLFDTYQREESNISRKKGRLKYGFQMASRMALWLAHDVESNPGPSFNIRPCLERITRDLSEALKSQLPVNGSLWSESVAEAAYAAGYSTDCQWSNPSGNNKDKLMTLIERAIELGRVLTTLGCLPTELAPFVIDLGNYEVQDQLVNHYKVKNLRSAVDIVLGIRSLGDEHKQAIMHEEQRLKQISDVRHSSKRHMDMCNSTDFVQLADSTSLRPNVCLQKKTKRRKTKRVRHRNKQGNPFDNLDKSQAVPEQETAVTLGQQIDPGSDENNENSIVGNMNDTLSAVSKVQEVTVQEDIATTSMSARNTDRISSSNENQTFSVGTKESEPFDSTGEAISIPNEILCSNVIINQSHDKELDDILVWVAVTETQVKNVRDDDARNRDMQMTATNYDGMTQLQKADENLDDQLTNPPAQNPVVLLSTRDAHTNNHMENERYIEYPLTCNHQIMELQNLIPGHNASCKEKNYWSPEGIADDRNVEESSMNINPDITESGKGSDSTLHENTGEGSTSNYLEGDRDNLTQDKAEAKAKEDRTGDDDTTEDFVQGEKIAKTYSETEFLQQTISPLATGSNSGHEVVRDEVTSMNGVRRNSAEDDTCENESEKLSSLEEQFAAANTETEPIQQTVSPLTAVTNSYPNTDRDEMYREETFDDNTPETRESEAEDLTFGTEQFASTEPADTGKQRMEPTVAEYLAEFQASLLEQVDARLDAHLEAVKAILGNNTPSEHMHVVQNGNEEPLDCASSDVEHTEPRVRSSDSSRKRHQTDPENGPTSKKWRQ